MKDFFEDKKKQAIEDCLHLMSEIELISLWNHYCECISNDDARVFRMYDFDSEMELLRPSELVTWLDSNFDIDDEFFKNGDYIESTSDIEDFVYYDELADYLLEYQGDDEWDLFFREYEQVLLEHFNSVLIQYVKDAKLEDCITERFLKWYDKCVFPHQWVVIWKWSEIARNVLIEFKI